MTRALAVSLVAVLSATSTVQPAVFHYPRRIVWQGTMTTADGSGTVVARTHLIEGRDIYYRHYGGRFHCHGAGCPMHHGSIELDPILAPDRVDEILFGARHPTNVNCYLIDQMPPPNFGINGEYICHTTVPPEPPPVRLFAQGRLNLVPSRFPQAE